MHLNLLESCLGPTPECLIQEVCGGAREFAFLTSTQVVLLVWEPHFEST